MKLNWIFLCLFTDVCQRQMLMWSDRVDRVGQSLSKVGNNNVESPTTRWDISVFLHQSHNNSLQYLLFCVKLSNNLPSQFIKNNEIPIVIDFISDWLHLIVMIWWKWICFFAFKKLDIYCMKIMLYCWPSNAM